jgi:hypothetical protein
MRRKGLAYLKFSCNGFFMKEKKEILPRFQGWCKENKGKTLIVI